MTANGLATRAITRTHTHARTNSRQPMRQRDQLELRNTTPTTAATLGNYKRNCARMNLPSACFCCFRESRHRRRCRIMSNNFSIENLVGADDALMNLPSSTTITNTASSPIAAVAAIANNPGLVNSLLHPLARRKSFFTGSWSACLTVCLCCESLPAGLFK